MKKSSFNNYVAKHSYKQNRADVFKDRKNDYVRNEKHKSSLKTIDLSELDSIYG